MTPQEIENDIKSVKRTCRVHFLIEDNERHLLVDRWNEIKDAGEDTLVSKI